MRGGGNATRQIIDILPPAAEADRLLVCEVLTPAGNWSSYPPHKHDRHAPPVEADLEETYYYRFSGPDGYGIQRLYTSDGRSDQTIPVTGGDLIIVRDGYHPFVAAPGFDAYYLNTLAGSVPIDGGDRRPALRAPARELAAAGSARADDRPACLTATDLQDRSSVDQPAGLETLGPRSPCDR